MLTKPQWVEIKRLLVKFKEMFTGSLGLTTLIEHQITLKMEIILKQLKREVKKMLDLGIIEELGSEDSGLTVLVPKPNHTIQFCIDFCKINVISICDAYPTP